MGANEGEWHRQDKCSRAADVVGDIGADGVMKVNRQAVGNTPI